MLTVEMTSMPASRSSSTSCQRFWWRAPGTLVWASSSTSTTSGARVEDRVDIHLGELRAAVAQVLARHDLEVGDLRRSLLALVGLDETDHHVGAALVATLPLLKHRVGLADARRRTQVDPELSAGHDVQPKFGTGLTSSIERGRVPG